MSPETSTAMTGCAPAATAPSTALIPTPPQPNTATRSPGRTPAVRQTAPVPGGHRAAGDRRHVEADVVGDRDAARGRHDGVRRERGEERVVVDGRAAARQPRRPVEQSAVAHARPRARAEVLEAARALGAARRRTASTRASPWRPARGRRTPAPTASTTPAPSCPSTAGQRVGAVPSIALKSEWQTPLACSRTRTSPGPGGASSSSCTASSPRASSSTAARIVVVTARAASPGPAATAAPRRGCGSASGGRARPRRAAGAR